MVETMVSDSRFQNQLASIMETLAKTAILEIGKLVEESHAVFRSEISRRRSENESLKNKCDLLESELRASRSAQQRAQTLESARPAAKEARHHPTIDSVFGKEWCLGLWKENGPAANQKSQSHVDCCMMESSDMIDDGPETIIIKDETNEDCPGKSKPQADPASEKDMEEDLESFLRSREVPEKDIYKMKRDKELREKIRARRTGSKVAPKFQARMNATQLGGMARHNNTFAQKSSRRLELGWLHFHNNDYHQVRTRSGGGTKHVTLAKHTTVAQIMETGKQLFFQNGQSPKGPEEDFTFTVCDFKGNPVCMESTVLQLYEESNLKMLRLYLCTQNKVRPLTDYGTASDSDDSTWALSKRSPHRDVTEEISSFRSKRSINPFICKSVSTTVNVSKLVKIQRTADESKNQHNSTADPDTLGYTIQGPPGGHWEMIIGKEDSAEGTSELKNSRVEERKTLFVSGQSSALSIISPTDQQSRQANAVDVMEANGFSEEMMVGAHDHAESTPGLNNCTVTSVVSDILTNCQPLQNAPDFMMLSDLSKVVSVADDQGKGKSGLDEISEEDHKIPDSACSTMWHEQCFESLKSESESYEESEDEMLSGEEYVLCSTMDTETESEQEDADRSSVLQTESEKATTACSSAHDNSMDSINIGKNETSSNTKHSTSYAELAQSTTLTKAGLNYCFVCGEAQSKIARHFKVHIKEEAEIAKVLSLPVRSGERKQLLETLRNRGNFNHNNEVLKKGEGSLKVKRRPLQYKECKKYEYCLHCKGMFLRRELWRHVRQCRSKPAVSDKPTKGRQRVLPKTATQYHIITSKKAETPTGLSKLPLGSPKLSTRVH